MTTPVETLNNAIYTLAQLNPENLAATTLNDTWQQWFSGARATLPDVSWWILVKPYWVGYSVARLSAKHTNERTPPAADIDPTMWRLITSEGSQRAEAVKDAAVATGEAIADVAKPTLLIAAAIGVGLLLWSMRK